jgi:MoaA/NifB/PqqE/SkfB family radical SAM enzyme
MASALLESGLDIIAFSLTGTDRESNSSRRGVDFDRVCQAISLLRSERDSRGDSPLQIHIAYLMLASNMPAVRHLPELMQSLGVQAAVISTLDYIAHPAWASEGIAPHEVEKLQEAATILKETGARANALSLGFHWALPGPDPSPGACRENVLRSLFVGADGSVSPCVFVNLPISHHLAEENHLVFGNVNQSNPVEIWESDGYRRFRDRFAQGDVDPPCLTCVKRFENLV